MNQNSLFEKYEIVGDYFNNYIQKYIGILGINATVLITGETGTGKELVARWVHFHDAKRNKKPFVKITIPNIGESIFESEVFGYEKGAFTGATSSKKGLIEVAQDGTIFFDEIENASPSVQSKLLQLLEDRIYRKVGDTLYSKTDARFIIATNKDLYDEVLNNRFRADLFYRLAVLEIRMPTLIERGKDILQIANYYVKKFCDETGKEIDALGEEEYKYMSEYNWPGNVRELKNFIEKAGVFSTGKRIDMSLMPRVSSTTVFEGSMNFCYKEYMKEKELDLIKKALDRCGGNISEAAKLMDMSVPFVYKKLKEYRIVT